MLSPEALGPRERIVDKAAALLREAIFSGELAPGQSLVQSELAVRLRVSRTPLREAIRKLEQEGLVTLNLRGQAVVREGDDGYVLELYRLREVVDGLAARLCAERVAAGDRGAWLDDLDAVLAAMQQAVDAWRPTEWARCNVRFHAGLLEQSCNRPLQGLVSVMRMSTEMFYPAVLIHRSRARRALEEHREIMDAIRSGRPEDSEAKARLHIQRAIDVLRLPRVEGT